MDEETVEYTMEHYSATKNNVRMPFEVSWLDLEIFRIGEISQIKTGTLSYHLYVESKI